MTENSKPETDQRWLECLHVVQSLSAEMNAGLAALAGNDLRRFETSVVAQERLGETARGILQSLGANSRPTGRPPRTPLQQLAAAGRELRQQNRVYAVVLTRAAQIGAALLSIYQDSPRGYSQDGRILPATNTWSCEV